MDQEKSASTIETFPLPILYQTLTDAQDGAAAHAKIIAACFVEITRRFIGKSGAAYKLAGKEHGTVRADLHEGFTLKADISKTVKWDQKKMKVLASTLEWAQVEHLFDITFKVKETIFKALMPGEVKDALTDAREVKFGDPKLVLLPPVEETE